jgi:hypothetical protein
MLLLSSQRSSYQCNVVVLQALQQRQWLSKSSILPKRSRTAFLQLWLQRRRWNSSSSSSSSRSTTQRESSGSFVAWYSKKLDTHPLLTKGITSGMIAGTGDFICQYLIDKREKEQAKLTAGGGGGSSAAADLVDGSASLPSLPWLLWWWDAWRTARFGTLGALYVAPGCHYWYGALAARFPLVASTTTTTTTTSTAVILAQRVGWDQFAFTPIFLVGWMTLLWTMERGIVLDTATAMTHAASESIPNRLAQSLPDILVANWVRTSVGFCDSLIYMEQARSFC